MIYLEYEEYIEMGGELDEKVFNRNIDRACNVIDYETRSRVEKMKTIPRAVKVCCRDLVDYIAENVTTKRAVSSRSQSAGAVSESESYAQKSAEEMYGDIKNILCDYLLNETDDNGTKLMYRGCWW
jgi:hypothetical protein